MGTEKMVVWGFVKKIVKSIGLLYPTCCLVSVDRVHLLHVACSTKGGILHVH